MNQAIAAEANAYFLFVQFRWLSPPKDNRREWLGTFHSVMEILSQLLCSRLKSTHVFRLFSPIGETFSVCCSIRWFRSRKRGHENGFAVEMKINGEFETFRNWDMKFPGEWTLIYMRNSSMRLIDYCSIAWYWKSSKLNEFYRRQTTWWIFSVLNPFPFIPLSNELISIVTILQATICLIHPFTSKCGQFFGKCIHFVQA